MPALQHLLQRPGQTLQIRGLVVGLDGDKGKLYEDGNTTNPIKIINILTALEV